MEPYNKSLVNFKTDYQIMNTEDSMDSLQFYLQSYEPIVIL